MIQIKKTSFEVNTERRKRIFTIEPLIRFFDDETKTKKLIPLM